MSRRGYRTISLPDDLIREIDIVVKKRKRGYSSRAELLKEGARKILDNLKKF